MGDRREQALRVRLDGKLRLEFHGARITSDAGMVEDDPTAPPPGNERQDNPEKHGKQMPGDPVGRRV
jgi:hypothetical protein